MLRLGFTTLPFTSIMGEGKHDAMCIGKSCDMKYSTVKKNIEIPQENEDLAK